MDAHQIVYSKNVVEFVTVASEYCSSIENVAKISAEANLQKMQKLIPLLYLKAAMLPKTEKLLDEELEKYISELDYNVLHQKWLQLLNEYDSFYEVFDPSIQFGQETVTASISENLLDIYQDLKNFLISYSIGNEEVMNDALVESIEHFEDFWGQQLVNVFRAIHMLVYSNVDFSKKNINEEVQPGKEIQNGLTAFGEPMKKQMMFKESITKEELTDLPLRWFDGEIVVVDNKEKLDQAVDILSKAQIIGFDTETKPAFKKGVFNKVALLQLSVKNQAFLIRINKIGLPVEICKILANPKIIKPGVAINDDIKALNKIKAFIPNGFVELQDHAKALGITDFSLKKLAAITCGFRISKGQQLSNWEAEVLTEAQQIYAATDAWVALEIFENFSKN